MALSTDYVYQYMLKLVRKNQAGSISATDFGYFWNGEQRSFFSDLMGRFNRNTNSKLRLDTGLIENQTIMTKLLPFTKPLTNLPIAGGQAQKPSDFVYTLAMRINGNKVFQIDHDTIWAVNQDVIDPPSIASASFYFTEYLNYFSILPNTVTSLDLDYISSAQDIVWAYSFDTNNRQVYNPNGIQGCNVIYGGVGYTTPTIAFSAPAAGGVQATGTLTVVGGVITAVVMTNIGFGYAGLSPTVTITGGNTTPAVLSSPIISVQPMWASQNDIIEITKRSLKSLGVHFTSADFEQFGNSVINTGD